MSRDTIELKFQTEFWIPKGRKSGTWSLIPGAGKAWRKVRVGHSHADKLAHSIAIRDRASDRERSKVCGEYCALMRKAGRYTVTTWEGDNVSSKSAALAGLTSRPVSRELYETVTEETES